MHRLRATLVGMTAWIPREAPGAAGSERARRAAAAWAVADRHAARGRCCAAACSWSAPPTARAPTCGPGRYTDLAALVAGRGRRVRRRSRTGSPTLNAEVDDARARRSSDDDVNRYQRKVERLKDPAGLVAAAGPGVTVTLSDAPEDVINSTDRRHQPRCVVHQQDIQAVVNALWKGGAAAVTIPGQRVISTTGIKCEGNAVQLQGVPYPQPYVIQAVGDQGELLDGASRTTTTSQVYRDEADNPDISVGWDLELEDEVTRRRTTACST